MANSTTRAVVAPTRRATDRDACFSGSRSDRAALTAPPSRRRTEPVADAVHRVDDGLPQLATQVVDVRVDGAERVGVVEGQGEQLVPGEHPRRPTSQRLEQPGLPAGQHHLAVPADEPLLTDDEPTVPDD